MGGLRPDHLRARAPPPCLRALGDYSGFALVIPKAFHGRSWKPSTRRTARKISPVFIRSIERAQERRIVTLAWVEVVEEARLPPRQGEDLGCTAKQYTTHAFAPKGHGGQHVCMYMIHDCMYVCMYMIQFLRGGVGMGGGCKLYVSGYPAPFLQPIIIYEKEIKN